MQAEARSGYEFEGSEQIPTFQDLPNSDSLSFINNNQNKVPTFEELNNFQHHVPKFEDLSSADLEK